MHIIKELYAQLLLPLELIKVIWERLEHIEPPLLQNFIMLSESQVP